jgi:hypothetical protein
VRKETTWKTWDTWEDNIKMDFGREKCETVDWIHVAQDKVQWRAVGSTLVNHGSKTGERGRVWNLLTN